MTVPFPVANLVGGSGGASGASITFCATAVDTTDKSAIDTYTFSSHSIGTASSDRYIIVAVVLRVFNAGAISSLTVAGTSCTQAVGATNSGTCYAGIWITNSPITSGTTATVAVNFNSGSPLNCGIATFAVTGLQSTTATGTATQTTENTATNLSVTAGGVAVALATAAFAQPTYTFTNITERFDTTVEASVNTFGGACDNQASTQTLSITIDHSSSGGFDMQCFASFR